MAKARQVRIKCEFQQQHSRHEEEHDKDEEGEFQGQLTTAVLYKIRKSNQIPNCVYDGKCTDFDAEFSNGYFCDDLNKLDCEFKASKGCFWDTEFLGANVCSYKLILALSAHLDAIQANSEMEYNAACNTAACKRCGDCCERSHSTDSAPTVLNFHVTVQNQPKAPPVFDDSLTGYGNSSHE